MQRSVNLVTKQHGRSNVTYFFVENFVVLVNVCDISFILIDALPREFVLFVQT